MVDNEFAIIDKYFADIGYQASDAVVLGPGDDCAILSVPDGYELCVSTDTLLEGTHFFAASPGDLVASRCFAASVSDLAAMGAKACAFTGALTMPKVDHGWLAAFSDRLSQLSIEYQIPLIGGNLSRGGLSITFTVMGLTPKGGALKRAGAVSGDDIYVTGFPGQAGAGLKLLQAGLRTHDVLVAAYESPRPRLLIGQALRSIATAAIDISDGLVADLEHLLRQSDVGAQLDLAGVPISTELLDYVDRKEALSLALTAGDDYELCFTAPPAQATAVAAVARQHELQVTRIGEIVSGSGIEYRFDSHGELGMEDFKSVESDIHGYRHF